MIGNEFSRFEFAVAEFGSLVQLSSPCDALGLNFGNGCIDCRREVFLCVEGRNNKGRQEKKGELFHR